MRLVSQMDCQSIETGPIPVLGVFSQFGRDGSGGSLKNFRYPFDSDNWQCALCSGSTVGTSNSDIKGSIPLQRILALNSGPITEFPKLGFSVRFRVRVF